jgi:16S rRNA (guanine527-N7)-methyltransferase
MIYDHRVEQAAIARLLQPYAKVDDEQLSNISIYIDLLLKWNSKMNLTAVRDPEQIVARHFGESLFAASHLLNPHWTGSIVDIGSGAGFPGLPLAMYAPAATVTLIESQGKKVAFLNEVIFALGLKNAKAWAGRAEAFPTKMDLVTMRAVERFEGALPIACQLVAPGGRLALMVGNSQVRLAEELGTHLRWSPPLNMPGGNSRVLLIGTNTVKVE